MYGGTGTGKRPRAGVCGSPQQNGKRQYKKQLAQYEKELAKAEKRLSEISLIIKRLYEDSVTGKLTDERFAELSKDYENETAELKARVRELRSVPYT